MASSNPFFDSALISMTFATDITAPFVCIEVTGVKILEDVSSNQMAHEVELFAERQRWSQQLDTVSQHSTFRFY